MYLNTYLSLICRQKRINQVCQERNRGAKSRSSRPTVSTPITTVAKWCKATVIVNISYSSGVNWWLSLESLMASVRQYPWNHFDDFCLTCLVPGLGRLKQLDWNRWGSLGISNSMWPSKWFFPHKQLQETWTSYIEAQGYRGKCHKR